MCLWLRSAMSIDNFLLNSYHEEHEIHNVHLQGLINTFTKCEDAQPDVILSSICPKCQVKNSRHCFNKLKSTYQEVF